MSGREGCIHKVLASAYSSTLQIRLCSLLVPIHWSLGAMATQPSVALTVRPFLGWQDAAGCWILVTVLDILSQIQAARQILRLYLQKLCYFGGTNQLEILHIGPVEIFFLCCTGRSFTIQLSCSELCLPDLPSRLDSSP